MSAKFNFWQWVYRIARKKCIDSYRHNSADLKCPNCNMWCSELACDNISNKFTDVEFGYKMTCWQCRHVSYWNCEIAPVALCCDETGVPIRG